MTPAVVKPLNSTARRLQTWFNELSADFGGESVNPSKTASILQNVEKDTGVSPAEYLGSCTNGIAFLTDRDTVLKFTIDKQEAVLWGQLWGHKIANIAQCYGSWQLVSRTDGPSIVYLVHVEFVPYPLDTRSAEFLKLAAHRVLSARRPGIALSRREMTLEHLRALREVAARDPVFLGIIDAVVALADLGVHIYDLQPDNFRIAADRETVKLIDPSTPLGAKGRPGQIAFEQKGLGVGHLLVY